MRLFLMSGDIALLPDGLRILSSEVSSHYFFFLQIHTNVRVSGGENIYPLEIEERLVAHPAVSLAVVTGLKDEHYGEVVGAFLGLESGHKPLSTDEVREWVRRKLGKHKAPTHVFWLGHDGVPLNVPLTGSGKVRKFEMAQLGNKLLEERRKTSKL